MSDFSDFRNSNILRNPTTWIVAVIGSVYGGYSMLAARELHRAEGGSLITPWLVTDRAMNIATGSSIEVAGLVCAAWIIAGQCENANVWIRQSLVILLYIGLSWVSRFI